MPRHDDEQPVTMRAPPRVWLLFGARAGDNSQVLALGELLGWPFEIRQIVFGRRLLPKPLAVRSQNLRVAGIDLRRSTPLVSPWPELVILSGREQEPVARWIRRAAGGGVRLVYMGRPWAPLDTYDLIITTPQYFLPERPNVVLNLLPLPVLDGGHLMYYLWEGVTGRSVSDAWMERLQRGGVAVLFLMMSIALFNDLSRLFG